MNHVCDSGNFDRTICPEPCGMMHSFCDTCGARADRCAHEAPDLSPERVGELAEVLAEHRLHASMNVCTGCDWRATPDAGSLADQHEAHRAQALAPLVARWVAEARAEGWDEGWDERDNDCSEPYSPPRRNPYRAALTTTEEQR